MGCCLGEECPAKELVQQVPLGLLGPQGQLESLPLEPLGLLVWQAPRVQQKLLGLRQLAFLPLVQAF